MNISAWLPLFLALPVLLLGDRLVRRIRLLSYFNIPAPVVGGLLVALGVLALNVSGVANAAFGLTTTARWWTWLVTPEPEWQNSPAKNVNLPFLVGFFACIGLNASWSLVKRAGAQILVLLLVAFALAVIQNLIGIGLARWLGAPALLGLVCGSVTMMGGHATALAFAPDLQQAGLLNAGVVGMAAATFGLVSGGLTGGPLGAALIRKHRLHAGTSRERLPGTGGRERGAIGDDFTSLASHGRAALAHLLLLLFCVKLGVWASHFLRASGLTFPVALGAMLVGVALRNLFDVARPGWIQTRVIEALASVALGMFLSMAMMTLNLIELAAVAAPMTIILSVQVVVMIGFAGLITYRVMGRDFDAAVMAAGHCGFGLGATPTAVANMKVLVENFGPAPRAFLVVPVVGAFLIDFLNALNITAFLNFAS